MTSDAHLHPLDGITPEKYPDLRNLKLTLSCTSTRNQWVPMMECQVDTVKSYGVHPWYCDGWDTDAESELLDILERNPEAQVGEIGLDSKRGSVAEQMPVFRRQLGIASEFGRIVSIHDIGCEKEILDAVREIGRGCRGIVLHSYSSDSYVKPFTEAGCMFSINPRILSRSEVRLKRLLSSIPSDRLLLESDAPWTAKGFTGMGDFTVGIAGILGMDPIELEAMVDDNLGRLLHG